jgi:[methyl-Co(III) methanol-specific corrinoid protein]:coenzyme M methyltransferase
MGQMEALGIRWPEAHFDSELLAGLALGAREILGFEVVRVPFDQTIEAEILGVPVRVGDAVTPPTVAGHSFGTDDEVPPLPDLAGGRASAVHEAVAILRDRLDGAAAVLGGVVGPFTLVGQILGLAELLVSSLRRPAIVEPWLDLAVQVAAEHARRQVLAGADAICVEDMSASLDLTSPGIYDRLVRPAQERLIRAIAAPVVLHVCGGNTKIVRLLAATGAAALSLDARTDLAAAVGLGACAVVGGVPPVDVLLAGSREDVRRSALASLEAGVHLLAPGCGIPPATPTANLVELTHVAFEWRA